MLDKILCKSLSCTAPPAAEDGAVDGLLELFELVVVVGAAGVAGVVVAAVVAGVVELFWK